MRQAVQLSVLRESRGPEGASAGKEPVLATCTKVFSEWLCQPQTMQKMQLHSASLNYFKVLGISFLSPSVRELEPFASSGRCLQAPTCDFNPFRSEAGDKGLGQDVHGVDNAASVGVVVVLVLLSSSLLFFLFLFFSVSLL